MGLSDDSFPFGNPGIGEYLDFNGRKTIASNEDFGFSSFTAKAIKTGSKANLTQAPPSGSRGSPALECYSATDLERAFIDPRQRSVEISSQVVPDYYH